MGEYVAEGRRHRLLGCDATKIAFPSLGIPQAIADEALVAKAFATYEARISAAVRHPLTSLTSAIMHMRGSPLSCWDISQA